MPGGAWFDREVPTWLSDPFHKREQGDASHVVVHSSTFVCVWYFSQGRWWSPLYLAYGLAAFVGFGAILTRLRRSMRIKYGQRHGPTAFIHPYYGVPEAWLNSFPLACGTLVGAVDAFGGTSVLPADPVRKFAGIWVCVYAVTHLLSAGSHTQFYDWFRNSRMEIADRRGWGARGFSLYGGLVPHERIPHLTTNQFVWLSLVQQWNFYLSWLPFSPLPLPPGAHFVAGFVMVILRHSMLFAENNSGMHKPCLLPPVCFFLACSPQLWGGCAGTGGDPAAETEIGAAWALAFLKLYIVSIYLAAGLGKVIVTLKQGKYNWADGTNMQYYLFVAMWARPGTNQSAVRRLGWLVQQRFLCILLGAGGLVFEIGSPMCLLGGYWSLFMFVVAVKFHYGIFFLQGIDFTGQWVPVLLVFLLDRRPVTLETLLPAGEWSLSLECVLWSIAAMHLVGQLFHALTFREVTREGDKGGIPYSCLHMFTINSNIFGSEFPSWYTLMTGDQRSSGHLGIMEWSGPIFRDFHMSKEDMGKLPFKAVWFGHTMLNEKHKFLDGIIVEKYRNKPFILVANFELGDKLVEALKWVCKMINPDSDPEDIKNMERLEQLVELQVEAQIYFFEDVHSSLMEDERKAKAYRAQSESQSGDEEPPIPRPVLERGESFFSEDGEDTPAQSPCLQTNLSLEDEVAQMQLRNATLRGAGSSFFPFESFGLMSEAGDTVVQFGTSAKALVETSATNIETSVGSSAKKGKAAVKPNSNSSNSSSRNGSRGSVMSKLKLGLKKRE